MTIAKESVLVRLKHVEIHYFKGLESVEMRDCRSLNALIGKNNSGKSSVLHALDMAGLALSIRQWGPFQPKLEIRDLFSDVGAFEVSLVYEDDSALSIRSSDQYAPQIQPQASEAQRFKSVLILPDPGMGMITRRSRNPRDVMSAIENRRYSDVNSLDILAAVKYYADHEQRGFSAKDYNSIINEIQNYFPDLDDVESDRTDQLIATLTYREYGRKLDILYSGTGLKHFLDVLLKITVSGATIVLIDEPEMALHPDLQRRFIEYLDRLATDKNIQFFMATHSPVLLNYADLVTYYKVTNRQGKRSVVAVPPDAIHTLLSDLGIRPSDVFNQDICLMVEGPSDVVFFEHVIRQLYQKEFEGLGIGVVQYGGGSAEAIISGAIDVSNITSAQKYVFWIRDRDSRPEEHPSTEATKFKNALEKSGMECHILPNREIEWYFPEQVHLAAQQGDQARQEATRAILHGDQGQKYDKAAHLHGICVPSGKYLRELLLKHLTRKEQVDQEIRDIIENNLIPWKKQILGE